MEKTIDKVSFDTSYLKLGNKTFVLKEIKANVDIDKEQREFYESKYHTLSKGLKDSFVSGFNDDWHKQTNHLTKLQQMRDVKIANSHFNKAIQYVSNTKDFLLLKPAVYHPVEIKTTKDWLEHNENINEGVELCEEIWNKIEKFGKHTEIIVTVKNNYWFPFNVGFNDKTKTISTQNIKTIHTLGSDYAMCIGNAKYEDFKVLSDQELSLQVSRINTFSPARSNIQWHNITVLLNDLITDDTFVSVRRAEAWTTA